MGSFLLPLAIILLVLAIIAGIFGFRGIARAGCLVSRIIFFILIAGFIISIVFFLIRKFF